MNQNIVDNLIKENSELKETINKLNNELLEIKEKLLSYKLTSKKYYETHKEEIIQKVKNYNKQNNYKPIVSSEKKKEYNKLAYQKRKQKNIEIKE
jgi:enoyl reductase-like protein